MKIVIYATHSFGTYEQLKTYPEIVVVGFGTKWEGFIKKAQVIHDYLTTLPDYEIVSVIDGFDSYIKNTDGLEYVFKQQKCKVLLSENNTWIKIPYVEKKVYGSCKGNKTANSGLMMGYVKEMKLIFEHIITGPSKDDQRNLNMACKDLPFVKIDTNHIIFENCTTLDAVEKSNAYICQIPATLTFHRIFRSFFEYSGYFILEIIVLILFIIICTRLKKKFKF